MAHDSGLFEFLDPTFVMQSNCSFDGPVRIYPSRGSHEIADAITNMLAARACLVQAKHNAPNYTAQWSSEDYYRDEQMTYNQACNDLMQVLRNFL